MRRLVVEGRMVAVRILVGLLLLGLSGCPRRCPTPATMTGGEADGGTGVIYATISVACGGGLGATYVLSTGTRGGHCNAQTDAAGNTTGGSCGDGQGNTAAATCNANGGQGTCTSTTGAGSCTTTREAPSEPTSPGMPQVQ